MPVDLAVPIRFEVQVPAHPISTPPRFSSHTATWPIFIATGWCRQYAANTVATNRLRVNRMEPNMISSTDRRQSKSPSPSRSDREVVAKLKELLQKKPLQLLDYWNIGEQLKNLKDSFAEATDVKRGAFRQKVLDLKLGMSESTLNKCLQFRRSFRATHLARLRRLNVPWTQLSSSFGYSDAKERIELLNKAKDEEWNVRELQREIQRLNGRRRGGGRKRKEPKSRGLLADVIELRRLSEIWNEYYEKVAKKSLDGRVRGINPDVLRVQLAHSSSELTKLQKAVVKAIESIATLSKKLPEKSST